MYLVPNKYTNISKGVIGISAKIIDILLKEKAAPLSSIYGRIAIKDGDEIFENFVLSLCFLYSIDRITYDLDRDLVEMQLTAKYVIK